MTKKRFHIAVLLAILIPTFSFGETDRDYSRFSFFYLFNSWTEEFEQDEIKLAEGVFGVRLDQLVGENLEFDLWGTFSNARYTAPGDDDIDFSSLNDTRLKGTYYLGNRIAAVSATVNLPTGKKELSEDQYLIALGVSDNSRKYVVRRFGQALHLGGELLLLPRTGNTEFQIGGGFLHKGSYQVLEDDARQYKFGDEMYGRVGFIVDSRPVSFRGRVILRAYSEDEFDGEPVFQSGNTMIIDGRLSYSEELSGSVGFVYINRGAAKVTAGSETELTEETLKSGRNEILLFASGSYPLAERMRALGRIEYKSISANEYERSSSQFRPDAGYIGLSAGAAYQFTLAVSASAALSYYTGSVDDDNNLSGIGVAAALTFRYW